jgi:hypothetical protein
MPITTLTNSTGQQATRVTPWGNAQVALEGRAVFSDPFDGTVLDTIDRWTTPVTAGAGAIAVSSGLATLTVGTGVGAAVAVTSIEKFAPVGISFLQYATLIQFEPGSGGLLPLNVNSFFGQGTPNGSYTASTPLADAIGFERTIDGKVSAVLYASNVRTLVKDLTGFFTDGAPHVVGVATRGDTKYFFVNDLEVPVALITYFGPSTVNLPMRLHTINHTTGPAVAPTLKFTGVQALDSGANYNTVYNGNTISRARAPTVFKTLNAVAITTETTIWTPAAGKKFRLMGYVLSGGTVMGNVILRDNTAGAIINIAPIGTIGAVVTTPDLGNGVLSAAANNVLTATGASTQTLSGFVFGTEE